MRNSIGFDWHPSTRELYFTSNGRDLLGNDLPDDGLFRVKKGDRGKFYGFPYCHVQVKWFGRGTLGIWPLAGFKAATLVIWFGGV